jgi:hypothetical protein
MQLLPLVGFYWRQNQTIAKLVGPSQSDKSSREAIDLAAAAVTFLKKYYPALNENNLLDDALNTLKEVLTPPPPINS